MHSTQLVPMWTRHEIFLKKSWDFSRKRQFCGFVFKFVWAVYGGDLTGFCQSFRKVILKNDQRQTKSKKSQNVHGYEPLWYAHSTALPQSYPASIGSGVGPPICKALIGAGNMPSAESGRSRNVLIHLYLVNSRTTCTAVQGCIVTLAPFFYSDQKRIQKFFTYQI